MRTQSGTQTCANRLHTTCCHSNTSHPCPIPYHAHKQTTYVETQTVQDKYKTIHLTPSHLPPHLPSTLPSYSHFPFFILAPLIFLPYTLLPPTVAPPTPPPCPSHSLLTTPCTLFTHTRPPSTTPLLLILQQYKRDVPYTKDRNEMMTTQNLTHKHNTKHACYSHTLLCLTHPPVT